MFLIKKRNLKNALGILSKKYSRSLAAGSEKETAESRKNGHEAWVNRRVRANLRKGLRRLNYRIHAYREKINSLPLKEGTEHKDAAEPAGQVAEAAKRVSQNKPSGTDAIPAHMNVPESPNLKKGFRRLKSIVHIYNEKAKYVPPLKIELEGGGIMAMGGIEGAKRESTPNPALPEEESSRIDISHIDKSYRMKDYSDEELKTFNLQYTLSPLSPKPGEKVFSWASINWSSDANSLVYFVNEQNLGEGDMEQIKKIKQIIEEKIDVSFDALKTASAITYLKNAIDAIIAQFGIFVPGDKRTLYEYYILRDFIGFGKLQPMMNDPNIEDISCDGVNIPVFIYHRNPLLGSLRTNVVFTAKEELDDFVMRLSQKCGKSISVSEPLSEGALPDGSRVQAMLETDIARRGSNFTIRKFTSDPLTPIHLLESGTVSEKLLAYFWYAIENNSSILIAGPTASGKTTLLNTLSLFIKPALKIVTIEDTPELKLPHTHWVPEVSRQGIAGVGGKTFGEVSMFDLLKSSLRQRPDYIIVGEVRGEEAYVLFQQMASGHSGLSTIHADSIDKVVDRLTTPPINLPPLLLETLDLVVFIKHLRYRGKYVRRIMEVREIQKYDIKEKEIKTLRVFKWSPKSDAFETDASSALLKKISFDTGVGEEQVKSEINRRIKIITWLKEKNISNYRDVGRIIAAFYTNPEALLEQISE